MNILKETETHRVRLEVDRDPQSPRDWDNLWCIVFPRLSCGDKPESKEVAVEVPIYAFSHGGIELSTSPFPCQFDSGRAGTAFLYADRLAESGFTEEKAREVLESEIETLNLYISGENYCWIIEEATVWTNDKGEEMKTWEIIDSCGSYIGEKFAKESALEQFSAYLSNKTA